MLRSTVGVLALGWLLLHAPDGGEVWIKATPEKLVILRKATTWGAGACTEVNIEGQKFAVRECLDTVRKLLDEAGVSYD